MSLLFTILEGARVNTAKVFAQRALTSAMDSVLAEYYGPLWDEYHIFAFNTGGGSEAEKEEQIAAKLSDYMACCFEPGKNIDIPYPVGGTQLYDISRSSLSIGNKTMLMDYQGKLFRNEAVEYMKYRELGDGVTLLLDKLSLLETPKKISYVYEEKQKVEEELVEIDKGILDLMELLDGLKTSKKGIELTKEGGLKTAEYFVKKLCYGELTKDTVGINQEAVFQALKNSYVNPDGEFEIIESSIAGIEETDRTITNNLIRQEGLSTQITQEEAELSAMEEKKEKSKADKKQIKAIKDIIQKLESDLTDLQNDTEEKQALKEQLMFSIETAEDTLSRLITGIEPIINTAITTIDNIVTKTENAKPLIEHYEEILYQEKYSIGGEVFTGLKDNLEELKRYTAVDETGYDFTGMKEILKNDLYILTQTENLLSQGKASLSQELYLNSKMSFENAAELLRGYRTNGLTLDYSTLVLDKSAQKDPLDKVNNLLQDGLTSLVIDPKSISTLELTQDILPSEIAAMSQEDNNFFTGLTDFLSNTVIGGESSGMSGLFGSFSDGTQVMNMIGDGINKAAELILYQEYIEEHFGMYPKEGENLKSRKPSVLTYEQEYLLAGKGSDQENLTSVISRIIFIRTIMDFVSILGDSAKRNEAKAVATALVGFTGLPVLVSITQVLILVIWSLAEALLDASALMLGKEVPIIKKKVVLELPDLFMISRSFLQSKAKMLENTKELSFSYQDYLKVFLLMKNKEDLTYRSMDLIQENVKIRYGEAAFRIQDCLFGYEAEASFSIAPKFTAVAFVRKYIGIRPKDYRYLVKKGYSY